MPEIYADWESLVPLTESVPVGTKCVVIGNSNCHGFKKGQIVTRSDYAESGNNTDVYSDANDYWWIKLSEIALLPADYQAEPKAEPKAEPTAEPKAEPKAEPTAEPKAEPKAEPTAEPKAEPTAEQKPERKVVQIAANPLGVVALCSDGAIWGYSNVCGDWNKLPPIPQD